MKFIKQLSKDRHIFQIDKYQLFCIINNNGKVISQDFNSIYILSPTRIEVRIDDKYYVADYNGNILSQGFDNINILSSMILKVRINDQWYTADYNGEIIKETQHGICTTNI